MSCIHPLDPLTSEEVQRTSELIKRYPKFTSLNILFNSICREEPLKEILLPFLNGLTTSPIPRRSFVILIERGTGRVFEVKVNLTENAVEGVKEIPPGNQPTLSPEDCFEAERIVKNDPGVIKRCSQLGLEDMDLVVADPWSIGYSGDEPEFENRRLVQLFMYARNFPEDNHYAHPLDFVTIVDIIKGCIVRIEDLPAHNQFIVKNDATTKVPKEPRNYDPEHLSMPLRNDVKPLQVLSPEGPSFTVDGHLIEWQKFSFRISFNYREGLVLHNVCYKDGNVIRPLFYRMSVSEMVVPYGDPRPPFHRKSAFDVGDYGLGFCTNSLELGCDCLGAIKYFDAILNDHGGAPMIIKNAICLHEEDDGILWKHTEYRTGKACVARSRKLILSFIVTVVNYEYAFYWKFSQDGTINFEIKATGELSTNYIGELDGTFGHATVVGNGLSGQFHQHIFAVRIDPQIDGSQRNEVKSVDVVPLDGEFGSKENPYGQGFCTKEIPLDKIGTSREFGQISPLTFRTWKISNPQSLHPFTKSPVAWKLIPGNSQPLLAKEGSKIRARAGFATRSLWVTPHKDDELFAAGFYVNQSRGGDGLPAWTNNKDDANLENEDIVLWHCFGVTHIPRVEDFPVMPVESCGFTLKPCNFFTENPGIDVPPSSKEANLSKCVGNGHC